jgi:hypothetical protein
LSLGTTLGTTLQATTTGDQHVQQRTMKKTQPARLQHTTQQNVESNKFDLLDTLLLNITVDIGINTYFFSLATADKLRAFC